MKYFGFIYFIFLSFQVYSQAGKQYFGQAMIDTKDEKLINEIQSQIRKNPSIKVIRIDPLSRQIFLITNELTSWSESDFMSIFGENSTKLSCLFIGVYGKDQIRKFPFKDCE